jgi:hypothetical protein
LKGSDGYAGLCPKPKSLSITSLFSFKVQEVPYELRTAVHLEDEPKTVFMTKLTLNHVFVFIQIAFLLIGRSVPFNMKFCASSECFRLSTAQGKIDKKMTSKDIKKSHLGHSVERDFRAPDSSGMITRCIRFPFAVHDERFCLRDGQISANQLSRQLQDPQIFDIFLMQNEFLIILCHYIAFF